MVKKRLDNYLLGIFREVVEVEVAMVVMTVDMVATADRWIRYGIRHHQSKRNS